MGVRAGVAAKNCVPTKKKMKLMKKAKRMSKVNAKQHDLIWFAKERELKMARRKNQQSPKVKELAKKRRSALGHFNKLLNAHKSRRKKGDTFTKWTKRVAQSYAWRALKKLKKKVKKISKGKVRDYTSFLEEAENVNADTSMKLDSSKIQKDMAFAVQKAAASSHDF